MESIKSWLAQVIEKNRINVGYKLLNAHTKELNTWKPPLNKQSKIQKPIKPKLQKTHKSKSTFCFFLQDIENHAPAIGRLRFAHIVRCLTCQPRAWI